MILTALAEDLSLVLSIWDGLQITANTNPSESNTLL